MEIQRMDVPLKNLFSLAQKLANEGNYHLAELTLEKAKAGQNEYPELLKLRGYVKYMNENYMGAFRCYGCALQINPKDVVAMEGKGLSLYKFGDAVNGLELLQKAASHAKATYMNPYISLITFLLEQDRREEAVKYLRKAERKSPGFQINFADLK